MHCLLNPEMVKVISLLQLPRAACTDATLSGGFAYPVNHHAYILNCLAQLPGHPLHLLWLTQLCICSPLGLPTNKCLGTEEGHGNNALQVSNILSGHLNNMSQWTSQKHSTRLLPLFSFPFSAFPITWTVSHQDCTGVWKAYSKQKAERILNVH